MGETRFRIHADGQVIEQNCAEVLGEKTRDGDDRNMSNPDNDADLNTLKFAAEQGNADAQFNLGVAYCRGLGVPRDYVEAVKWCLMAA